MHGLEKGILRLVPYNPDWPKIFEREKARLQAVLQNPLLHIEHIGSTSVPGLLAKPIIDMALIFETEKELWQIATKTVEIGYVFRGPHLKESHWYAVYKQGDISLFHLHILQKDAEACRAQLQFRDQLRKHAAYAAAYAAAKKQWAKEAKGNRLTYSLSKDDFVRRVLEDSL